MRVTDPAPDAVPAAPSTLLAEEIHRLIGRSRRLLWMASARSLEARGDSPFTWQVLCYLVHHGPTVQQDLAMATAQDPAGMSRVLDDLEGRKLVRRSPDTNDRRRSIVEATKKGTAWYRSAATTVATALYARAYVHSHLGISRRPTNQMSGLSLFAPRASAGGQVRAREHACFVVVFSARVPTTRNCRATPSSPLSRRSRWCRSRLG